MYDMTQRVAGWAVKVLSVITIANMPLVGCYRESNDGNARSVLPELGGREQARNQPSGKKCLGIVGGAPSTKFPQVGYLFQSDRLFQGGCTGTFLSDTTVLTASHCLMDTPDGGVLYVPGDTIDVRPVSRPTTLAKGIASIKVFIGAPSLTKGKPKMNGLKNHERDIAIVVFPKGTFQNFAPVLTVPLQPDQELTLVGYGDIVAPNYAGVRTNTPETEIKRSGTNRLAKMDPGMRTEFHPDLYFLTGDVSSDGTNDSGKAIIGFGDSGGPLFAQGAIAAVASSGGVAPEEFRKYVNGAEGFSAFVSLQSAFAREFFQRAIEGGAKISFTDKPVTADMLQSQDASSVVRPCEG